MDRSAAFATDTPDIGALQQLFQQCSPVSHGWHRVDDNDDVRYTWWEGQSPDGKKWDENQPDGKPAFPFDGASDARVNLADWVVNRLVDLVTEAFHRSVGRVSGSPDAESSGTAARARKLMNWVRTAKIYNQVVREVELLAQNGFTYGSTLLEVGWDRRLGYKNYEFKMELLLQAAAQAQQIRISRQARSAAVGLLRAGMAGGSGMVPGMEGARGRPTIVELFPAMIMDPALDADSARVLQQVYAAYAESQKPSTVNYEVRELSLKRAREAIRELREEGKATLPVPYLCKDEPFIRARKLWCDAFVRDVTSSIQEAPEVFVVDWYGEADLRAEAEASGWDEEWVEQAVKHKGEFSAFTSNYVLNNGQRWRTGSFGYTTEDTSELIEVITCYRKLVDEDGVLGVYKTVFHGNFGPHERGGTYAWHGLQEEPIGLNYPLSEFRQEVNDRALCSSRGIPQIMATQQRAIKVQLDAVTDRTSFETLPPILVPAKSGVDYRFNPAGQIPVTRMDLKPEFMQPPRSTPGTAFELMDRLERWVDRYFGFRRTDDPPEEALLRQRKWVRGFLLCCSEAFQMVFQMMLVNLPPETIARITGSGEPFASRDEVEAETALLFTYDPQENSPEFIELKLKAVSEIAASDPSGTIDQAKLTRYKLRAIDPALEAELTTDVQGAANAVFSQVKDDFLNMSKGVPAQITENDPTSAMQLKFGEQLLRISPHYQMQLKSDQNFQELVKQWVKNKQFSLDQMANKQIGRVGVDPRSAE